MNYKTYAEIPVLVKEYIMTVADTKDIKELQLEDINSFLTGLEEYDKMVLSEYDEGGWVL